MDGSAPPGRHMAMPLCPTGLAEADHLVSTNAFALLVAMQLDQQITIEWAFRGPYTQAQRLGDLSPQVVAELSVDEFVSIACVKPTIHRFPAVMARRIHELAVVLHHRNEPTETLWLTAKSGIALYHSLGALPGFADEKIRITIAVLGKQFNVRPRGWRQAAGVFSDRQPRTVADVDSPEALVAVKAWKANQRAAGLSKDDRPQRPKLAV